MDGRTLYRLFEGAAHSAGSETALILPGETISYARFHEHILGLASQLHHASDRPGAVAILAASGPQLLQGFFACAAIGRPALPLDPALPQPVLSHLLERHPPAALLISKNTAPMAGSHGWPVIPLGDRYPVPARMELPGVEASQEFYWGMTSGTTGQSKLFARSHASWTSSFDAAETVFPFPPRSQILIPGPLHQSLFLYGAVHALCRGHAVLLPGAFRPSRVARCLGAATHLYAVPFMLGELAKAGYGAPKLGTIFSGGAKLTAGQRRCAELAWPDADLVEFYGASETSFLTFHSTRHPRPMDRSAGRFPAWGSKFAMPAACRRHQELRGKSFHPARCYVPGMSAPRR